MNLNPKYPLEKLGQFEPQTEFTPSAPSYSPFRTTFASISMHSTDLLRFLNFTQADIQRLRICIQSTYRKGIQREQPYGQSHEFKFYGTPWYGQNIDAIISRILIREILAELFRSGWILHANTDVSKKTGDKDTLLFRKQQTPPPPSDFLAISFNQYDRLRTIGAPPELVQSIKDLLIQMNLLQTDNGWKDQSLQAREFKLKGYPWMANREETMTTRFLLLKMLECLEVNGWSLYASIDQNMAGGDNSSETDTWYCAKDRNWVEGAAVFHR